ncbi:SMEK domain-containing protein [Enterobacter ludwigii]|uniref:SMEK domain-containing protein n=1 Tax=Enterobacter ludwigii TaxID=299767 RepID=UPI003F5B903E
MLERKKQNEQLTLALARLSTHISFNSKQSMFDNNRVMETILPTLLNQLYGYALMDLNTIKHNHPAIDLGDAYKRLAVQITSDGSKDKMVTTLDKFKAHGLDKNYDTIWFLIISNAQKCEFTRQGFNISVKNLADIAQDICQLPKERFEPIFALCKNQFKDYFQENSVSVLAPVVVSSSNPAETITNFLTANDLVDLSTWQTNATHEDIRNDLIDLKQRLSELNDDQRWFIYQVMKWSIEHQNMPEYCMVPLSVIQSGKDRAAQEVVRTTVESLESIKMAYYVEESYELKMNAFSVHFVNNEHIEVFDYFSAIATFLKKTEQKDLLDRIVVHCDFSVID